MVKFDAVQCIEEIEVPELAPELTICERLKTDGFLFRDEFDDEFVFHQFQLPGRDGTALKPGSCVFKFGRTKQPSNVIRTKRRSSSQHSVISSKPGLKRGQQGGRDGPDSIQYARLRVIRGTRGKPLPLLP